MNIMSFSELNFSLVSG